MKVWRWAALGLIASVLIIGLFPRRALATTGVPFTISFSGDTLHTEWHAIQWNQNCTPTWDVGNQSWLETHDCDGYGDSFVAIGWDMPNTWQNVHLSQVDIYADRWSPFTYTAMYNGTSETCSTNTCTPNAILTTGNGYSGYDLAVWHYYNAPVGIQVVTITGTYDDLDPTVIPNSAGVDGTCKMCVYSPTGDWAQDAPSLINFLACQIGNIYYCHVIPILLGIWRTLFRVLLMFQASFMWIRSLFEALGLYIASMITALAYYINGSVQNAGNNVVNGLTNTTRAYFSSGSGSSVWDAIIAFFNNIGGVLTGLLSAINGLGSTIVSALEGILHDTFGFFIVLINGIIAIAGLVLGMITGLINILVGVVNFIIQIVMIVPRIIATFQSAMSAPSVDPMVGIVGIDTLDCTHAIIKYYCAAGYVLDNTVLSSSITIFGTDVPILLALIQIIIFFIGLDRLLWLIKRLQTLGGAGNAD